MNRNAVPPFPPSPADDDAAGPELGAVSDAGGASARDGTGPVDVLLVCSTGGHLFQLVALGAAWEGLSRAWVSFDKSDARSLLADERLYVAYGPTNRSVKNFLRNIPLAWHLLRELRPAVIVTTGAGVAVPFAWLGRLLGARVIYVESYARLHGPSLSLRLIAPVAHRVYVQWPELCERLPKARYRGSVVAGP